jgi:Cu(I)/Ag(I) efflux system membrane fusion protein
MKHLTGRWRPFYSAGMMGLIVLGAFLCGYWLRGGNHCSTGEAALHESFAEVGQTIAAQHKMYLCPMMDVPPMENPGRCPVCGMELIAVSAGQEEKGPPRLQLSEDAVRVAEIQLAPVERKLVSADVRLYGKIEYDPAHVNYVTAFMRGVIDRVYVKRTGKFVRWGEPLFSIYSPDLYATQQQLIEAMKYVPSFLAFQEDRAYVARDTPVQERKGRNEDRQRSPEVEAALRTVDAVRHKLLILGMPKRDIDELLKVGEPTGIANVYAPMYGQVVEQNAFEGTFVNAGTPIFTLADPRYLWVKLDAYEADYPWIRLGQKVSFETDAYPGEAFEGDVININPVFKAKSRTFEVGVICPDTGGRLKAGLLVRSSVHAALTADGKVAGENTRDHKPPLVIPASAPLLTGKRAVVYVAVPGDKPLFEGREVLLGPKAGEHYIVLNGLNEGDRVVAKGSFKIDSAVQILAKPSMMTMEADRTALHSQPHGGSQAMHDEYWPERTKSRIGNTESGDISAGGGGEQIEHDDSVPKAPSGRRATILRRRPGAYGDSTQQVPRPIEP